MINWVRLIALICFLGGCEHENIVACEYACKESGGMLKYSPSEGCICVGKTK